MYSVWWISHSLSPKPSLSLKFSSGDPLTTLVQFMSLIVHWWGGSGVWERGIIETEQGSGSHGWGLEPLLCSVCLNVCLSVWIDHQNLCSPPERAREQALGTRNQLHLWLTYLSSAGRSVRHSVLSSPLCVLVSLIGLRMVLGLVCSTFGLVSLCQHFKKEESLSFSFLILFIPLTSPPPGHFIRNTYPMLPLIGQSWFHSQYWEDVSLSVWAQWKFFLSLMLLYQNLYSGKLISECKFFFCSDFVSPPSQAFDLPLWSC